MNSLRLPASLITVILLVTCSDYDVNTADSPANRAGFERHVGFSPGADVTGVFYYADELGSDARYQLSFQCPRTVADKVRTTLALKPAPASYSGLAPRDDLKWWTPRSTEGAELWIKVISEQHHYEFWYSEESTQGYFHEYRL